MKHFIHSLKFMRFDAFFTKAFARSLCLPILLISGLTACESTNNQSQHVVIDKSKFADYEAVYVESAEEIFALDQQAYDFVDKVTQDASTEKQKLSALVYAIFDRTELSLIYQASANSTAQQTFEHGTANCLSLTIMTHAMSEYLNISSTFQDVDIPEYWTRRNGSTLINRHVNLLVKAKSRLHQVRASAPVVVDFDPQQGVRRFAVKELSENQMVSFFYTNKGSEFLIQKEADKAFAYLLAAIELDPKNEGAWLNMGVLFAQHGYFEQAKTYYLNAMALKHNYSSAYENLAVLYGRMGEHEKAEKELAKLHKKRLSNPYYHIMLGDKALENKEHESAIDHYLKALAMNKKPHEFHFSLAKAYYAIGDTENTKKYLESAQKRAKDARVSEQYASKISLLANR